MPRPLPISDRTIVRRMDGILQIEQKSIDGGTVSTIDLSLDSMAKLRDVIDDILRRSGKKKPAV